MMDTVKITNLWYNELSSKQTNCGQSTVHKQRDGSDWINCCVDVCKSLEPLQSSTITIPYRAMPTEKNFHRPQSPPQNLVQTI